MVLGFLSRTAIAIAVSAATVVHAAPAAAQAQEGAKASVPHEQLMSANPFGLVLGWWNVEFERKITPSSTWGVSGSLLGVDDVDFASVNGLWRYYPQGAAQTVRQRSRRGISTKPTTHDG